MSTLPRANACPHTAHTRCRDDGVECIVRPRANAAILTDDLRWQQTVESRLQTLTNEIAAVKAANAELQRQLQSGGGGGRDVGHAPPPRNPYPPPGPRAPEHMPAPNSHLKPLTHPSTSPPSSAPTTTPHAPLPSHLSTLRDILQPTLDELERPTPLDVSIDDATVLWE